MLAVSSDELLTPRLVLRPLQVAHAAAFWEVLRKDAIYAWIERAPPGAPADVEARFARIAQRSSAGRSEQWLNWTVWTRAGDTAVGVVEATVPASGPVLIAYMFAPEHWGKGFAGEAVSAAMAEMARAGAVGFEAAIDARNVASLKLVQRLGFTRVAEDVEANEEVWRRGPQPQSG